MRMINRNIERGRNKTLKQFQETTWEKTNFTSIAIVTQVNEKFAEVKLIPSLSYRSFEVNEGYREVDTINEKVICLRVVDLVLEVDDVVVVVFADMDFTQAINEIREGRSVRDNFVIEDPIYHNSNFGIIINKIII